MKTKISKSFLSIIVVIAVLMGGLAFGQEKVSAAYVSDSKTGLRYEKSSDNKGWVVTSFSAPAGFSGKLVIPASYQGIPVVKIGYHAIVYQSKLTSVTIAHGIKELGEGAFYNNKNLVSVSIPASIVTWGRSVFSDCAKLKSVTSKLGLKEIGPWAFSGCTSLATITMPETVAKISSGAFYKCTNLVTAKLGRGITSIEESAFYGCTKLKNITFPDGLKSIKKSAFKDCDSLTSIVIPGTVKTVEENAFYDATKLSSVILREGVTAIKSSAFSYCTNLSSVFLPGTLKTIGNSAFSYVEALKQITIPSQVTTIEALAFLNTNLTTVTFNGKVNSIGNLSFYVSDLSEKGTMNFNVPLGTTAYYASFINHNLMNVLTIISPYTIPRFNEVFNADGLSAKSASYNSIQLTWAPASSATGYEVSRSTSANGTFTPVANVAGTSYTNTGLTTGTKYYYRIKAYYGTTTKTYSLPTAVVMASPALAVPSTFKAARASSSSIKLTWKKVAGAKGYEVRDSAGKLIKSTTAVTYTKTKLKKGTTYYYKVRAYTMVGKTKVYGPYSVVKSAKPY